MPNDSESTPDDPATDRTADTPETGWRLYDFAEDCLIPRKPEPDGDEGLSWAAE